MSQLTTKRERFLALLGVTTDDPEAALRNLEQTVGKQRDVATGRKVRKGLTTRKMKKPELVRDSQKEYAKSASSKEGEKQAKHVLARGSLDVPEGASLTRVKNPGLRATLKKNVTLFAVDPSEGASSKTTEATAGTIVAVHDTSKKDVIFVEVFTLNDKKKLKQTGKGYTFAKNVKLGQKFVPTNEPLFPDEPKLSDVKQGAIGDCYLMAGLGSVVDKDPTVIKRAILDNGDGTVTVRLFDKTADVPPKFVDKFINFEKSILKSEAGDHAKDTLWVQMLEKAYAIHLKNKTVTETEEGSYLGIGGGGHSNDVFEALLGRPCKNDTISSSNTTLLNLQLKLSDKVSPKQVTHEDAGRIKSGLSSLQKQDKPKLSEETVNKIVACFDGVTAPPGDVNFPSFTDMATVWNEIKDEVLAAGLKHTDVVAVIQQHASVPPAAIALQKLEGRLAELTKRSVVTTADVNELLKSEEFKALPRDLQEHFRTEATAEGCFPGPQGSGVYSKTQDELWDRIEDTIKNEGCVAMGTREHVGEKITGRGQSAGEPMSEGLVGNHAYSITGTYVPKEGEDLYVPGDKPVKYLRVRNPWGDGDKGGLIRSGDEHGRKYIIVTDPDTGEFVKMIASPTHEGEFFLELSDLTRRCENLYATEPLVSPESKLRSEVKTRVEGTSLDGDEVYKEALAILYDEGEEQALARVQEYADEVKADQKRIRDFIDKKTKDTTLDAKEIYAKAEVWLYMDGVDGALLKIENYITRATKKTK